MIGIDGSAAENGSDWFCYHATSPCIFPVGFCEINHLEITPPRGIPLIVSWISYSFYHALFSLRFSVRFVNSVYLE